MKHMVDTLIGNVDFITEELAPVVNAVLQAQGSRHDRLLPYLGSAGREWRAVWTQISVGEAEAFAKYEGVEVIDAITINPATNRGGTYMVHFRFHWTPSEAKVIRELHQAADLMGKLRAFVAAYDVWMQATDIVIEVQALDAMAAARAALNQEAAHDQSQKPKD